MNYVNHLSKAICLVILSLLYSFPSQAQLSQQFGQDAEIESKIDSLLSLMTLEEKIGQLTLYTSDIEIGRAHV